MKNLKHFLVHCLLRFNHAIAIFYLIFRRRGCCRRRGDICYYTICNTAYIYLPGCNLFLLQSGFRIRTSCYFPYGSLEVLNVLIFTCKQYQLFHTKFWYFSLENHDRANLADPEFSLFYHALMRFKSLIWEPLLVW